MTLYYIISVGTSASDIFATIGSFLGQAEFLCYLDILSPCRVSNL